MDAPRRGQHSEVDGVSDDGRPVDAQGNSSNTVMRVVGEIFAQLPCQADDGAVYEVDDALSVSEIALLERFGAFHDAITRWSFFAQLVALA